MYVGFCRYNEYDIRICANTTVRAMASTCCLRRKPVSTLNNDLKFAIIGGQKNCRYTVRCNRADIAVSVSSYNDIELRALPGLTHATSHSD